MSGKIIYRSRYYGTFQLHFSQRKRDFCHFFFKSRIWDEGIQGKIEARNEGISLYTFLKISPRKIYNLKKTKVYLRELNKVNVMNVKKMLLYLTNIL